ncbi:MAG: hypothetical protein ACFHVJ_03750 [Aestuariibacter sp.]
MKKVLIAAALATAMAGASAQEASNSTFGNMATEDIVAGAVAVGVVAAVIANATDDDDRRDPVDPGCPDGQELNDDGICVDIEPPPPQCNEGDELIDGVCVHVDITVTVSGTTTIEIPVTTTYLPSR